jgi:hypothetical protein
VCKVVKAIPEQILNSLCRATPDGFPGLLLLRLAAYRSRWIRQPNPAFKKLATGEADSKQQTSPAARLSSG